jgi:RNA polymerase sigma factor (sigma-70 family)
MMTHENKQALFNSVDVDRLINMRLARIYVPGCTRDDLVQEGRLAAWTSLDNFDAKRGRLDNFLTHAIKQRFIKLIRATQTQKRRPPVPPTEDGLDTVPDPSPTAEDAALTVERDALIRRAVSEAREQLPTSEVRVMDCYMQPEPELLVMLRNLGRRQPSKLALARYLGITPDRLRGMIRRIRRELSPVSTEIAQ